MANIVKSVLISGMRVLSSGWEPRSRLILAGDNYGWSLDWDMRELRTISEQLGIRTVSRIWHRTLTPQAIFLASQFFLENDDWFSIPHNIGFSYFHGLPNTGDQKFDAVYAGLRRNHARLSRVQVSHSEMYNAVLDTRIDPAKVHLIPIGINLDYFHFQDAELRQQQRTSLGIPEDAFVIGSFQKDGNGWGEGLEPKLIKGPDIFLRTLEALKSSIPELYVLLTGPARGYVKKGLEDLKIPYKHFYFKNYPQVGKLFTALDLYLITSRQEGGPKAVLESMATGVPLVTTRVGQAMDLVRHGQNGWIVEVEDVDGLAHWADYVYQQRGQTLEPVLQQAHLTAQANSYSSQISLWGKFMDGFVSMDR